MSWVCLGRSVLLGGGGLYASFCKGLRRIAPILQQEDGSFDHCFENDVDCLPQPTACGVAL